MKIIYRGLLIKVSNGEEDDLLGLVGDTYQASEPLAETIKDDIVQHGDYLSVRYYTSDKQMTLDELNEALFRTLYGEGEARYGMHYSEITGYLWTDEEINVGGHDLLEELKSYLGKWLHLEIEYTDQPKWPCALYRSGWDG